VVKKYYKEKEKRKRMEWIDWFGRHVFVQLKSGGCYTGTIIDVDENSKPLIFITILDKFNKQVTFVNSEIIKIVQEEEE
jgi:small nuclear ribonucleoprotein (snRNP)-like protein